MSLKKHYCDFYHFALLLVYLCAWCRVFLFLSQLLINAGFFYSRRSTYANIKSKRRLFNFSIYMFCLYASASRRSTDYL